jgi:hypothetical protein
MKIFLIFTLIYFFICFLKNFIKSCFYNEELDTNGKLSTPIASLFYMFIFIWSLILAVILIAGD